MKPYPTTAPHYDAPAKWEYAIFAGVLFAAAAVIALLCLAGCSSSALPGLTASEGALAKAKGKQLSQAAAAVGAAKFANQANPDGLPKKATAGELSVADANLPEAAPEDAREALARVNAALTGKLEEAQRGWDAAIADGQQAQAQIADLEKRVAIERAAAAQQANREYQKLCVTSAIAGAAILYLLGVACAAAGSFLGLPRLYPPAAIFGASGTLCWITATQVGTDRFNFMAGLVILGALGGLGYAVYIGYKDGSTAKVQSSGFERIVGAIQEYKGMATDGGEKLLGLLSSEMDEAHKWAVDKILGGDTAPAPAPSASTPAGPATSAPASTAN